MKIYCISDTHFGHDKLVELSGRPEKFTDLILANLAKVHGDLLIHCGDFCIGDDEKWHKEFMEATKGFKKRVLVRGNHDGRSDAWYIEHGWDFVCDMMENLYFGKHVLFTHKPYSYAVGSGLVKSDINIHGHMHGNTHRMKDGIVLIPDWHKDLAPEINDYKPLDLEKICNGFKPPART